jgi:hypothetical protein
MPDDNLKAPSQVFKWFEKMKTNYENSVQTVLHQFESFTTAQQERVDNANHEHISNLTSMHNEQNQQNKDSISHLRNDIEFYKKQVIQQQKTIEQLNSRYDVMMSCLLTEKRKDIDIKEIFSEDDFCQSSKINNNFDLNKFNQELTHETSINKSYFAKEVVKNATEFEQQNENDNIFEQALNHRKEDELEMAFSLFQQAAQNGHIKAMGAMGRSYFLAEGVNENQTLGLAWLINAAEQKLPQAISRVEQLKEQKPELFLQAYKIADNLIK